MWSVLTISLVLVHVQGGGHTVKETDEDPHPTWINFRPWYFVELSRLCKDYIRQLTQ